MKNKRVFLQTTVELDAVPVEYMAERLAKLAKAAPGTWLVLNEKDKCIDVYNLIGEDRGSGLVEPRGQILWE